MGEIWRKLHRWIMREWKTSEEEPASEEIALSPLQEAMLRQVVDKELRPDRVMRILKATALVGTFPLTPQTEARIREILVRIHADVTRSVIKAASLSGDPAQYFFKALD